MGYQPQKYYWISYPILALIPKMWDKGKDNLFSAFCFVNGNAMIDPDERWWWHDQDYNTRDGVI